MRHLGNSVDGQHIQETLDTGTMEFHLHHTLFPWVKGHTSYSSWMSMMVTLGSSIKDKYTNFYCRVTAEGNDWSIIYFISPIRSITVAFKILFRFAVEIAQNRYTDTRIIIIFKGSWFFVLNNNLCIDCLLWIFSIKFINRSLVKVFT